jgi:F-type H+-transporting ATPase subunit b
MNISRFHRSLGVIVSGLGLAACLSAQALASSPKEVAGGHDAHGASHGFTWFGMAENQGDPVGFGYILINFLVLLFILNRLVFRPLRRRNEERSDRIRAELEKATAARVEAEAMVSQWRERMESLEKEIAAITDEARRQAALSREELLATANADAESIRQGARDFATREATRIRRQVEAEVITRAVEKAEALIRANFNAGDQGRLVAACVSEIKDLNLAQSDRSQLV